MPLIFEEECIFGCLFWILRFHFLYDHKSRGIVLRACLHDMILACRDISSRQETPAAYRNTYNIHFAFTWDFHPVPFCRDVFVPSGQDDFLHVKQGQAGYRA